MHKILYFSGIFAGGTMLILSIWIWFKLGVRKAFRDILSYGSKQKWSVDQRMQNKTMPLRKTHSGRLTTDNVVKNNTESISKNKSGGSNDTVLLENYHGQIINKYDQNMDFEIIEEINLIAGGK
ncbi:hypothetical protein EHW90_03395 [Lachnoanaerobaculum orale]|jgi:hypothetical protein|uniref:Uncharacterized protein n=1 Tax=Lachnoanaerobaculum orale TaxID=979627 RepID=A0A3P3Q6M3_9FIRM|nr:hypothetical protein [Lachnoanaerobaculum orale]MBF1010037.1 hypothetical protein [Lachnoanaerobaculum sp.]RRJ16073.1 hypothetical protein EHW90_03395 [Lachnoanaerobaculum orale]